MRKLLTTCAVLMAPTMGHSQPLDAQRHAVQPDIRLPAITSRWKRPGDKDGAEITLDEIERCIGQDVNMQRDVIEVKRHQAQLQIERAEVDNLDQDLKQRALAIDTHRANIEGQGKQFKADTEALSTQASAIEKRRTSPPRSQAEVNSMNALIAAHNLDAARLNKRRSSLIQDQGTFNQWVEMHNLKAAELGQMVRAFNEHHALFQSMAATLTRNADQYVAHCAGERLLKK